MAKRQMSAMTTEEKGSAMTRFFRETKAEMRKVIWPTKAQLLRYLAAVLVSVVLVSLLIVAVDFVFVGLSRLLVSL